VTVTPTSVNIVCKNAAGEKQESQKEFAGSAGVKAEVESFAASIAAGSLDPRGRPQEAISDLRVLQAMLDSGEQKGAVRVIVAK